MRGPASRAAGLVALAAAALAPSRLLAGPPYEADDPEPVPFRHWELYLATYDVLDASGATGTAPHVEVNYGAVPNVQLHAIVPLAFDRPEGGHASWGLGDLELGAKLRFIDERPHVPMVGTFPLVEVPTGSVARGLGEGEVRVLLPIWVQKGFGPWLTYGGAGVWLERGRRPSLAGGWLVQRSVIDALSIGAELYADDIDGFSLRARLGTVFDLDEHQHLLLSVARSVAGPWQWQGYAAYLVTL